MENFKLPSEEEFLKMEHDEYEACWDNRNEFAFWFPKIKQLNGFHLKDDGAAGIVIPKTVMILLPFEWYQWLRSDNYSPEKIEEFTQFLLDEVKKGGIDTDQDLFIKTGLFSDKFSFKNPHVKRGEINRLGQHFLDLSYNGMCVDCPSSNTAVIREFIHTDYERPAIYEGMKLNTEFRVFYNFESGKLIETVNYWDRKTMLENLRDDVYDTPEGPVMMLDKTTFSEVGEKIEAEFSSLRPGLEEIVKRAMHSVTEFDGVWSIDFLWTGKDFALIDMAMAGDSFFYDQVWRRMALKNIAQALNIKEIKPEEEECILNSRRFFDSGTVCRRVYGDKFKNMVKEGTIIQTSDGYVAKRAEEKN